MSTKDSTIPNEATALVDVCALYLHRPTVSVTATIERLIFEVSGAVSVPIRSGPTTSAEDRQSAYAQTESLIAAVEAAGWRHHEAPGIAISGIAPGGLGAGDQGPQRIYTDCQVTLSLWRRHERADA